MNELGIVMIGNVMSVEDECLSRGLLAAFFLFLILMRPRLMTSGKMAGLRNEIIVGHMMAS
jgi:hypothetical protein